MNRFGLAIVFSVIAGLALSPYLTANSGATGFMKNGGDECAMIGPQDQYCAGGFKIFHAQVNCSIPSWSFTPDRMVIADSAPFDSFTFWLLYYHEACHLNNPNASELECFVNQFKAITAKDAIARCDFV